MIIIGECKYTIKKVMANHVIEHSISGHFKKSLISQFSLKKDVTLELCYINVIQLDFVKLGYFALFYFSRSVERCIRSLILME